MTNRSRRTNRKTNRTANGNDTYDELRLSQLDEGDDEEEEFEEEEEEEDDARGNSIRKSKR